uniref:Uncharacterized protein n=1 Tax=Anopheles merus TaxID=30066 RepID=A0A182VD70_ANOME
MAQPGEGGRLDAMELPQVDEKQILERVRVHGERVRAQPLDPNLFQREALHAGQLLGHPDDRLPEAAALHLTCRFLSRVPAPALAPLQLNHRYRARFQPVRRAHHIRIP